ncbi:MAG: hypothetical protein WD875_02245 [Pirellulales bacterium]
MKFVARFALCAAVAAGVALVAETASAQDVQVRHYMSDYGIGSWERPYSSSRIPTPPYFSIHPPVYYSYPVPRTYGYTPWAYPSYVMTPEIKAPVEPAVFDNPYVQPDATPAATTKSASVKKASTPVVIENPHVTQPAVRSASLSIRSR